MFAKFYQWGLGLVGGLLKDFRDLFAFEVIVVHFVFDHRDDIFRDVACGSANPIFCIMPFGICTTKLRFPVNSRQKSLIEVLLDFFC